MESMANSKKRSASIDLFRIISMLMVVFLHLLGHGGVLANLPPKSANFFVLGGLESLCIIAVNCFALTTGFLYVGKKIKLKNILNLYLQVLSFSLIIAVFFFLTGKQQFETKTFLKYLFPISSGRYWYFSAYFILFFMMPLLNVILEYLSKKFLYLVLIISIFLFGIYTFASSAIFGDTFKLFNGYSFIWLAVLYLFGGAIKKYEIYSKFNSKRWLLFYLISAILSFIIGLITSISSNFKQLPFIEDYTFIFNILSSCLLLIFFANLQIKPNKIITFFAKHSFGVYLFHEHPFIRQAIIKDRLIFIANYNPLLAILTILGIALLVYLLGTLIEFIRKLIFKLIKLDKLTEKIDNKIVNLYNKNNKEQK